MLKYDARHYDNLLRLRISPLLWLALIYGVRHFLFVAAAKLMPLEVGATPWIELQAHAELMWSDLPALLVLIATGHRIPNALRAMRWIWLHGRWILASSFLLGVAVFLNLHLAEISNPGSPDFFAALCVLLPDIAIIGYLLRSALVRDIFGEFPETPAEAEPTSTAKPKPVSSVRQLRQELDEARRNKLLREQIIEGGAPADLQTPPGAEPPQWMQAAAKFEANGRLAEAEALYRELLGWSPDFAPGWHALGLLAYHAGKSAHGAALVEQAIKLDGAVGLYQRNLGEMYRRMGRLQKAVSLGRAACRLSPGDADACHNLGLALMDAGRLKEALASYRDALKLDPKHGLCWNNLGVVLQAMGDRENARQAYIQALNLNPANAEAQKNLRNDESGPP